MIRPSDLAHGITDRIAAATQCQAVWRREPLTLQEFAQIRKEVWAYFDSLRLEMEKEAEAVKV